LTDDFERGVDFVEVHEFFEGGHGGAGRGVVVRVVDWHFLFGEEFFCKLVHLKSCACK
jgi:hypothetical protein